MSNACNTGNNDCHEQQNAQQCTTGKAEQECPSEKLLCLADEAWKELVKEKIKAEIEKTSGAKIAALAKLVAEANGRKWQHMIQAKAACNDYKSQIQAFFSDYAK